MARFITLMKLNNHDQPFMIYTPGLKRGVLLVSSPRSGSTLISNMLRSHSKVIFLNEVFTRAPYLLPAFEERFSTTKPFDDVLSKEFEGIYNYTLPFANHSAFKNKKLRYLINLLVKCLNQVISKKNKRSFQNPLYKFWYLNSLQESSWRSLWMTTFYKKNPSHLLLKDVQIHKSIQAFKSLYPNGKVIYLIRHPYGFFSSTIKSRKKPKSSEVPITKYALINNFGKEALINDLFEDTVESKFLLSYRFNNEFAIEYLNQNFAERDVYYLKYEDFITNKNVETDRLFNFIGIEPDNQSKKFLSQLMEFSGSQRHARSVFKSNSDLWDEKILEQYDKNKINAFLKDSILLSKFNYTLSN